MSESSAYRPPSAYPSSSGSRDPEWTTGQGIGFLVALPGWILVSFSMPSLLVGLVVFDGTDETRQVIIAGILGAAFGMMIAIPGTVVFNKCKRP